MNDILIPSERHLKENLRLMQELKPFLQKRWVRVLLVLLLFLLLLKKDITIEFGSNGFRFEMVTKDSEISAAKAGGKAEGEKVSSSSAKPSFEKLSRPTVENSYIAKLAGEKGTEKLKKQHAYVKRFAHVAQAEMNKFGIPASITLAQGLLETSDGQSILSKRYNNHFGIKSFSRRDKSVRYHDDSPKDRFRIYNTAWESYRHHSLLLTNDNYRHLGKLGSDDYKAWAKGLKKAGYATDKRYAEKLIKIIEELKLYEFDEIWVS